MVTLNTEVKMRFETGLMSPLSDDSHLPGAGGQGTRMPETS